MKLLFYILTILYVTWAEPIVDTKYEWKYLHCNWKSEKRENFYLGTRRYDYKKMIPIDVDRSLDGRVFITVAKDMGVPASLYVVTNISHYLGPLLTAYPSWKFYERRDTCNSMVSAHRIAIDECNRLWILDTGVVGVVRICPATLWYYNLYNDLLIQKIKIPDKFAQNEEKLGLLVNLVVETAGIECERTTVYIADAVGNGIVVYRSNAKDIYRYISEALKPEDENTIFSIAEEHFTLAYGIFGMALTPKRAEDHTRFLTFAPLASRTIYSMNTRGLRNKVIESNSQLYIKSNVIPSQATVMVYSSEGILFYGLTHETAIGCWNPYRNSSTPFVTLLVDSERLQFISGMKFIHRSHTYPDHLLLLTNRFQKVFADTMNFQEINFRIIEIPIEPLVSRTLCEHV